MIILPLVLQLFACPSPPDPNQANAPNNPAGQNQPNNAGGQNQPPAPEGDTPKAPGKVNPGNGPDKGSSGNGGTPPPGEPGMGGLPPIDGNIIQESVIVHIVNESPEEPPARFTQEKLKDLEHVTLSGTIDCAGDGCDAPMLLRVIPFMAPDSENTEDGNDFDAHITMKEISGPGPYSILVPKSDTAVVFELLVDINEDGLSNKGDRMAVLEKGGQLIPSKDLKGLNLNATDQEEIGPLGGPAAPENPMNTPPPPPVEEEEPPPPGEREPGPEGDGPGPEGDGPGPEGEGPGPEGEGPGPEGEGPAPEGDGPSPE